MAYFGNSSTITTTGWKKGNIEEFRAKQACKDQIGDYASAKLLQDCIDSKLKDNTVSKSYSELAEAQSKLNPGTSAANGDTWSNAWKSLQINQMKKNIPIENFSDPTPLLIDKISSLPPDSARRRSAENIKMTLDGTATNIGSGMDNLTRESYKEIKRLVRHSNMLCSAVQNKAAIPSPNTILKIGSGGGFSFKQILGEALGNTAPGLDQVLGLEEGSYTSNMQDWRPYFVNAVRPISDAIGSHAAMDNCIIKNAAGTDSIVPPGIASLLDKISPSIVDGIEGVFKSQQMQMLTNLPSKIAGSVRQLSTALDSILSVPFEIMSDVYNGLMQLIDEIANLLDNVLSMVINWAFSIIGGLIDAIFPISQLEEMLGPIFELAGELSDIFDLFGGFPAMAKISSVLSIVSGGFGSILTNLPFLYTMFKAKTETTTITKNYDCITEIFELTRTKLPRIPKVLKVLSAIGGVITNYGSLGAGVAGFGSNLARGLGNGIGNLGAMAKGFISNTIGSAIQNVRNFTGLLANLLPAAIGGVLHWLLHKLCKIGMVGDLGFSAGSLFDFIKDRAFSLSMSQYATHHSIIAPLFGKECIPRGAYHAESYLGSFENSRFVIGAQGTKGVTMLGIGGSLRFKPLGLSQGYYAIGI